MNKFLSLFLIISISILFDNKGYANNDYSDLYNYKTTNKTLKLSITGKYRFLGILYVAPYSNQGSVNVYTDGYSYYCSYFTPSQVDCRTDNELRESHIFNKIYKDEKGCYSHDYYGDKYYLFNPDTLRIVQDVRNEVYYADWMY